ncbi:MAG: hypothetical protein WKF37_14940 [Bryobacteraceae bacterium]
MFRSSNLGTIQILGVAVQAIIQDLLRLQLGKSNDGGFAPPRFHMRLARAVATFTPGYFRGQIACRDALIVRIFEEGDGYVGMTGLANSASNVLGGGRVRWRR